MTDHDSNSGEGGNDDHVDRGEQVRRDAFAQQVIDRLRAAGVASEVDYQAEDFQLAVRGDKESILFLGNAYHEYNSLDDENRSNALRRFIRGWLQAHNPQPEEYADILPDLLPALRSRSFFEAARLRMEIEGNEDTFLPYQIIGDDLGLGLVYDMPDSMKPISNKELDLWGVTFYEALESARQNLLELRPRIIGPEEGEGMYVFTTNDGYDSTRLVLLELIHQFEVRGDYIAMVPGREMLIVAGSDDTPALEAMVALTKNAFEQPRTVSAVAQRLERDEWTPWMPAADHPLYNEFQALRLMSMSQDYAEQKTLLDKLHERKSENLFAASYFVMQHKESGAMLNYCLWSAGIRSLLPRAERVVFGSPDQPTVMASWERVEAVVGDMMTPLGIYPERYRVDEFPTPEQLAEMGNELGDEDK